MGVKYMRIGFLFTQAFWGGLLILVGISAILRSFNINIPLMRIVFAFLFIYVGIAILLGHGYLYNGNDYTILFSNRDIRINGELENEEYNIIFSSGMIDLSDIKITGNEKIEVNTIFSSGTLFIPENLTIDIKSTAGFGHVSLPNGNSTSFGELTYHSEGLEGSPVLRIETSTVFAGLEIIRK